VTTATVSELDSCEPSLLGESGATLRTTLDAERGSPRLVQQVLRLDRTGALDGHAGGAGELWYVASGAGRLDRPGAPAPTELRAGLGLLMQPGAYRLTAGDDAEVEVVVVVLPEACEGVPGDDLAIGLEDCEVEVTGDREFRVLVGPQLGCGAATQFVGFIPPGRAPVHEHTYDEVVFVLEGEGVVHLADGDRRLRRGTCVYLPPGSPHCLENTGSEALRVLGVFHPGGSPAAKKEHAG